MSGLENAKARLTEYQAERSRLTSMLRDYDGSPEGRDGLRADIAECNRTIARLEKFIAKQPVAS